MSDPAVVPPARGAKAWGIILALIAAAAIFGFALAGRSKPAASPAGLLAGRYKIVRLIGKGGMAEVFEGFDQSLARAVAVKKLGNGLKDDPQELARFLEEAKTVAGLKHDNIVVVHDAFEENGAAYCVFELVEGETLDFRIRQGNVSLAECLALVEPLAEALDYAHSRGIIHRDLKPSNIMLEKTRPKIMDFGVARRSNHAMTQTGRLIGTPAYMAPEMQAGEVSRESDLYALAVTVYEMLQGRLPFQGFADKVETRFSPILPPALSSFFAQALAAKRENRFHSGQEFAAALETALG